MYEIFLSLFNKWVISLRLSNAPGYMNKTNSGPRIDGAKELKRDEK